LVTGAVDEGVTIWATVVVGLFAPSDGESSEATTPIKITANKMLAAAMAGIH
jgi:hypothetical protein